MMNDYNYIIASLNRVLDYEHVNKKLVHLVSSVFFTNNFDVKFLKNYSKLVNKTVFIHFVDLEEFTIIEHTPKLIEIRISLFYFLLVGSEKVIVPDYEKDESKNRLTRTNLHSTILGSPINISISLIEDSDLDVYFIFENFSWPDIKTIFGKFNFKLSGGSITKRDRLSVSDYKLAILLNKLSLDNQEIHFSFSSKNERTGSHTSLLEDHFQTPLLTSLTSFFQERKSNLDKSLLESSNQDLKKVKLEKKENIKISKILKLLDKVDSSGEINKTHLLSLINLYLNEVFNYEFYDNQILRIKNISDKYRQEDESYNRAINNSFNYKNFINRQNK